MSTGQSPNEFWFQKNVKPGQLLISDISIQNKWHDKEPRLELNEVPVASIFDEQEYASQPKRHKDLPTDEAELDRLTSAEQTRLRERHTQYGWMSNLRLPEDDPAVCRWIHISSTFPDNLAGVFQGLSDWTETPRKKIEALQELTRRMYEEERYSKHGRMFAPFFQPLVPAESPFLDATQDLPLLISTPFLDWSLHPRKDLPPLRFQVDAREQFFSGKQATHPLRSLLQYQYRLEDTSERDQAQVLARHKPWYTDREVDLKVRRWFGHYPSSMVVDELWILVVDAKHIVTFSSNQTWKSRWPPMQVASRIGEVSFRGIRDMIRASASEQTYTALTHAVTCLHGSIGLMHRSFWTDMPLPCTERYGDYLSHLQYRIYRQPSTKLVMDLLQILDELNVVLEITNHQLRIIQEFSDMVRSLYSRPASRASRRSSTTTSLVSALQHVDPTRNRASVSNQQVPNGTWQTQDHHVPQQPLKPWLTRFAEEGDLHLFTLTARPIATVDRKLRRELDDLTDLRNNANELVTRTVQLVNIRMEDNGQAILVFTVVTIIFLPLSFVSSLFGMNVREFKEQSIEIRYFWAAGLGLTAIVVSFATILAFYGAKIREMWTIWRAGHDTLNLFQRPRTTAWRTNAAAARITGYTVSDHWR